MDTITKINNEILIKCKEKPKKIYKYYPYNQNFINSITEDYIWLSSPSTFNDPFESHINNHFSIKKEIDLIDSWNFFGDKNADNIWHKRIEHGEDAIQVLKEMVNSIEDIGKRNFANAKLFACFESLCKMHIDLANKFTNMIDDAFKVGCLSADPLSMIMWSHYASSHNGVCIEYSLDENPYLNSQLQPVIYTKTTLSCDQILDNNFLPYVLLLKGPEWAYEKEWRIISAGKENKFPAKASAIYLGARAIKNNTTLSVVQEIAKYKRLNVIIAYKDQNKYALNELSLHSTF